MKFESHPDYPQQLKSGGTVLQDQMDVYAVASAPNVENYVGTVRIPVGLAGPVDVLVENNRIAALYPGGAPETVRNAAARTIPEGTRVRS